MFETNEVCVECNSHGINYWDPEVVTKQPILLLKYNIFDCNYLLTTEGSSESMYDVIRVENYGEIFDGFPVGKSDGSALRFSDSAMLVVADSSKIRNKLRCN